MTRRHEFPKAIWILTQGQYSDRRMVGATWSPDLAEAILHADPDIEITAVPIFETLPFRPSVRYMSCVINHRGGIQSPADSTMMAWPWEESHTKQKTKVVNRRRDAFPGDRYTTVIVYGTAVDEVGATYASEVSRAVAAVEEAREAEEKPRAK